MRNFSHISPDEIPLMREAGKEAARLLDHLSGLVLPGATTESLDQAAALFCKERGLRAAPLNYSPAGHQGAPFPKSICASVNHQICHGIPGARVLKAGDLLKLDVTVIREGFHGDSCRSFLVGGAKKSSIGAQRLARLSLEALWIGIQAAQPGAPLSSIGAAIEIFCSDNGLSTVKVFCGHGIGREFHMLPQVRHYFDPADEEIIIEPGMALTVEPMICAGSSDCKIMPDGWTAVTQDHSLCAQWEHTLLIGDSGPEALTHHGLSPEPERQSA